jgi:hypothetical protein
LFSHLWFVNFKFIIRFYVGKDTFNITEIVISALAKNGSFGFAKGWPCVSGQNQMCHLRVGNKIGFKKCAVEKK